MSMEPVHDGGTRLDSSDKLRLARTYYVVRLYELFQGFSGSLLGIYMYMHARIRSRF